MLVRSGVMGGGRSSRLGFACAWERDASRTWSGIPWNLRRALADVTDVVDVGVEISLVERRVRQAAHARRREGRWVSPWRFSRSWEHRCYGLLEQGIAREQPDVVVEIQDLATVSAPFFLVQDLSFDVLAHFHDDGRARHLGFPHVSRSMIERRRERQHEIYERAAGVFAMSDWFARTLVEWTGVAPNKVSVVPPGTNNTAPLVGAGAAQPGGGDHPPRLLFVGREFARKGGDLVVAALDRLRRHHDPDARLTIAGPASWPGNGPVPDGVAFLGEVDRARLAELYASHDVFVMPSRFEAFGIVFAEALASGLPCVARNEFAMPEIVRPGVNGGLVDGDDPEELAAAVVAVLDDHELRARCRAEAAAVAGQYSWARAAEQIVARVNAEGA